MSERAAFIRAICESPACDTARLVFADWLDEHGEPEWATFIRRGVGRHLRGESLAAHSCAPPAVEGEWQNQVKAMFQTEWVPAREFDWKWSRGFIYRVELPCAAFLAHAGEIFARHPVAEVRLTDRVPLHLPESYEGRRVRPAPAWELHGSVHWRDVDPAGVPWEIWADAGGRMEFAPESLAHSWLSRRCVAYGRNLAGLPPLPEPAVKETV